MLDAESRWTHVESLCLVLYYVCSKFWQYILSSSCTLACQYDVVKHMMQRPILSGRLGKWAYALVECELNYEPLCTIKGQVMANFIIGHVIKEDDTCMVAMNPWKLFFDGSVCAQWNGIICVLVEPHGDVREIATRVEFGCTNNQAKYESLTGLEALIVMEGKDVEAFGDSNLMIQQVHG
jgi:hypothetical protein